MPAPDPDPQIAAALAERDAALADAASLRNRLAGAGAEADRLHGLLRRLHGMAGSAAVSDLIAGSIDLRGGRAAWPGRE
jgi:hypothetical protein